MSDTKERPPDRCYSCKHFKRNTKLEYYPFPYCGANGKEISFGSVNGHQRMKWCPLLTEEEQKEELLMRIRSTRDMLKHYLMFSLERDMEPEKFMFYVRLSKVLLEDMETWLKKGRLI